MFDFWQDEVSEEETEQLLNKAADEIRKRRLEGPAILFFEMHKPLSNVFAHAGAAFAPFMVPVLGYDFVQKYSSLLQKRDNVERLIELIERPREDAVAVMEESCQRNQ
jgi:hypothetical protein